MTLKRQGSVVAQTLTDANGDYSFKGRKAATYTLEITTPGTLVAGVGGDPAIDSDLSPATVVLSAGKNNADTDFGFAGTGSIGDRVWIDENCNGLQDAGEGDLDEVLVILFGEHGFKRDTLTVNGFYLFTNLSAGTYSVFVDGTAFAPLLKLAPCNAGTDPELDSECNPAKVVLPDDETHVTGTDFGYCPLGTGAIGDLVWHDLDLDGLQDMGEPGIPMVPVFLEDTSGMRLMKTLTDAAGRYTFKGLSPGDYMVDLEPTGC